MIIHYCKPTIKFSNRIEITYRKKPIDTYVNNNFVFCTIFAFLVFVFCCKKSIVKNNNRQYSTFKFVWLKEISSRTTSSSHTICKLFLSIFAIAFQFNWLRAVSRRINLSSHSIARGLYIINLAVVCFWFQLWRYFMVTYSSCLFCLWKIAIYYICIYKHVSK